MPPVVAFVAGALGVTASTAAFIVGLTVSLAISAITTLLIGKPKLPSFGEGIKNRTINIREPIAPRQILYGRARVGGVVTFVETSSASNEFLHLILSLAGHPVEAIDEIFFDDEIIPLDGNGDATGNFAGLVRVKKGLGTTAGDADFNSELQTNVPTKWTVDHKQEGVAKLYVRLKFDRDKFNGIPNISAFVRGKKVFDPRDSQTRYTPNAALCVRDYLTDAIIGFGENAANINDTDWIAEANICEESVSLAAQTDNFTVDTTEDTLTLINGANQISALGLGNGITLTTNGTLPSPLATATTYYWIPIKKGVGKLATTKANAFAGTAIAITTAGSGDHTMSRNSELRYLCDGLILTEKTHKEILGRLLTACAGRVVWQGGQWNIYTGAFRSAAISYDENESLEAIQLQSRSSKRELINRARGVFADPDNNYQPTDFPIVTNATYLTEDLNDELWVDMDLDFTTSSIAAQRLGKIEMEKSRQQLAFEFTAPLKGLRNKAGDTIQVSNSRFGWTNKVFEVQEWHGVEMRNIDGALMPVVVMNIRETASTVFSWAQGEETKTDPAPDTNLPNPNVVGPPEALLLQSGTNQLFVAGDGTVISRILVTWDAPTGEFAVDGYEVDFKLSSDTEWSAMRNVHDERRVFIEPVQDGVDYDVRVRSVNVRGAKSGYVSELGHTVTGKLAPPSPPDSFDVAVEADGTRRYSWAHASPDPDVRSGGGYKIRYFLGSTSNWAVMTPVHDFILVNSPYTSNELGAGTYTFAIKSVDSTGNESTAAVFISNVALPNPRIANAIIQRNEQVEGWPGIKYDCFLNNENHLEASGAQTWNDLPATWASLADRWTEIVNSQSPISYTTPIIDLGRDFSIKPIVNVTADGTVTSSMMTGTSAQGSPLPTSDLVLNGDFATDLTGWTDLDSGTGVSDWNTGRMRLNGGASGVAGRSQAIAGLTIGKTYQIKFDTITNPVVLQLDGDTLGDSAHLPPTAIPVSTNLTISFVAKETTVTIAFSNSANQDTFVDNISLGEFDTLSLVVARYLQINVAVGGTDPILKSLVTIVDAPALVETFDDIDTLNSTDVNFQREAAGHFKIRTQGGISQITQAQIVGIGGGVGGGFTWELVNKDSGFGSPLVSNFFFTTDISSWTDRSTGTGSAAWQTGGFARLNGGASGVGALSQSFTTVEGQRYLVVVSPTGNGCEVRIDGATHGDGLNLPLSPVTTAGAVYSFIAVGTSAHIHIQNANNNNSDVDLAFPYDGTPTAEFKVYNASNVLTDATVDILLRGART